MKKNKIQTSFVTILFIALGIYFAMMIRGGSVEMDNTATGNVLNSGVAKVVDDDDDAEVDATGVDVVIEPSVEATATVEDETGVAEVVGDDDGAEVDAGGVEVQESVEVTVAVVDEVVVEEEEYTCPVAVDIELFETYVFVTDEMPPLERTAHRIGNQYEYTASRITRRNTLSESPSYTYPPHARPQPVRPQEMVITLDATTIVYDHEEDIPESRRSGIRDWLSSIAFVTHAHAWSCDVPRLYSEDVIEILRITSSSDFSEQFPAGSSLNRLFDVRHSTASYYYFSPYRVSDSPDAGFYNVDEFVETQPKVGASIQFTLNTEPTASDTHQFFIEYRDSGGRDLTVSTQTIVFDMDAAE